MKLDCRNAIKPPCKRNREQSDSAVEINRCAFANATRCFAHSLRIFVGFICETQRLGDQSRKNFQVGLEEAISAVLEVLACYLDLNRIVLEPGVRWGQRSPSLCRSSVQLTRTTCCSCAALGSSPDL